MKNLPLLLLGILIIVGFTVVNGTGVKPEMERCVDLHSRVVDEQLCNGPVESVAMPGSLNPVARYQRYYGGFGDTAPGSYAWGGSDRPLHGHVYQSVNGQVATPRATSPAPGFYMGAAMGSH